MRQIDEIVELMDYLERREKLTEKKTRYWTEKHNASPDDTTLIKLTASMGAYVELQTIMLRIIGYKYSEKHLLDEKGAVL